MLDQTLAPVTQIITYVKREGEGYPGNVGHYPGTNLQEGWRIEIDRLQYLNAQESHHSNDLAIRNLRQNIALLEMRAAERHGRSPLPMFDFEISIELQPTCPKCGHIGCEGTCHSKAEV